MNFELASEYQPTGDQPEAIERLFEYVYNAAKEDEDARIIARDNNTLPTYKRHGITLLGVTGSGKTFTIANTIARLNRPTLVISHNKTLAAQLYGEFKNFFPNNAVEYFVSYYDYFQPEAYIPSTDTYIEKDLAINDDIERMRLKAVTTLLSGRKDIIVVSSVSCIYGCGNPYDFREMALEINVGEHILRKDLLQRLVELLYSRVEGKLEPSTFRVNGEVIDIMTSYGEYGMQSFRISFFDKEVESIHILDPDTGLRRDSIPSIKIYPSNLFMTTREKVVDAMKYIREDLDKQIAHFDTQMRDIEAQRIKQRVEYDLEMINELGYCSGIENYSRYFDGRQPGTRPFCLLDYFPDDFVVVVDESHVTVPQIRGMSGGDKARKQNLVEYGFRLPAALDNRPLHFSEFEDLARNIIYVSATPAEYETELSMGGTVTQLIRPTHIIDPALELHVESNQIDDMVDRVNGAIKRGEKVIITTISKSNAEEMSRYLDRIGISNRYIHSDVETLNRIEILEDLREGRIDVIVGVNLLREGIDLPEVALVVIFDADKQGFLRNVRSITQIAGRGARHKNGKVVLYCNYVTDAIKDAIKENNARRTAQINYNYEHGVLPRSAKKSGNGQSTLLAERTSGTREEANKSITAFNDDIMSRGMAEKKMRPEEVKTTTIVAENMAPYTATNGTTANTSTRESVPTVLEENIERLIAETRVAMEEAAKNLNFTDAIKHRDRMYELQKLLEQQR